MHILIVSMEAQVCFFKNWPQYLFTNAFFLGASDNGVSVAVALEVLEVISRMAVSTQHPIIFLFNGAEEKGMLV